MAEAAGHAMAEVSAEAADTSSMIRTCSGAMTQAAAEFAVVTMLGSIGCRRVNIRSSQNHRARKLCPAGYSRRLERIQTPSGRRARRSGTAQQPVAIQQSQPWTTQYRQPTRPL